MVAELDELRTELMTEMNERTEELRTENQAQHAAVMERFDGLAASYEGVSERLESLAAATEERFDSLATTIAEVKTTNEGFKEEFRHLGLRVGQLEIRVGQINSWKMALIVGGLSGVTIVAAVAIATIAQVVINGG